MRILERKGIEMTNQENRNSKANTASETAKSAALSPDTIVVRGKSKYQHGPSNDRVYLMKLDPGDCPALIEEVEALAKEKGYSKIFAKTGAFARPDFLDRGYVEEAHVPNFYHGREDAYFWGKYVDPARATDSRRDTVEEVLAAAKEKRGQIEKPLLKEGFTWRIAREQDAEGMVDVYKVVFETYPFPIHDPSYLRKTMNENIVYFVALDGDRIVAVASSEMDEEGSNVEMTDFATLPECRGSGIAVYLLHEMELAMRQRGIRTAYTIARALSFGMNITFSKLGYQFAGTLINNTNISGQIESMNVWYKPLG